MKAAVALVADSYVNLTDTAVDTGSDTRLVLGVDIIARRTRAAERRRRTPRGSPHAMFERRPRRAML